MRKRVEVILIHLYESKNHVHAQTACTCIKIGQGREERHDAEGRAMCERKC